MNLGINSISQMNHEQINQFPVCSWGWETDRRLFEFENARTLFPKPSYEEEMGETAGKLFFSTIQDLKEKDIYLDVGAGNGKAIATYRRIFKDKAQVVGVSVTRPDEETTNKLIELEKNDDKFSYYMCDFLNFPADSLAGRVSLITDIYGATTYAGNPTRVIQQIGKLLKEGGLAFIKIDDSGIIPTSENKEPTGEVSQKLLDSWFHTIRGFDVIKTGSKIVLRKNSDAVEVDTLVPTMERVQDFQGRHAYKWELSEHSKSMLLKNEQKKQ